MKYIKRILFALTTAIYTSSWWIAADFGKESILFSNVGFLWVFPAVFTAIFITFFMIWLIRHWNDDRA